MQLTEKVRAFLQKGARVSTAAVFDVSPVPLQGRNELLASLVAGKQCLHVGCADHPEVIQRKRDKGTYLHDVLRGSARTLLGVDVDPQAVALARASGASDIYLPEDLPKHEFDIVCAPDVIEHVGDARSFLEGLRRYGGKEYVVTTPNAYRLRNRLSFSAELINTDHACWYSPYTLCKAVSLAGYEVEAIWYTDSLRFGEPVKNALKKRFPLCRDGLCVSFRDH